MSRPRYFWTGKKPFQNRPEGDVRFEGVIMPTQIDQLLRLQYAVLRSEEIDPLAVAWSGDTARPSAVAGEYLPVGRRVEMHRPVFALDFVSDLLAAREYVSGQPEDLRFRRLQVIPDGFAVGAEELVPGDFHLHCPGMNLRQPCVV